MDTIYCCRAGGDDKGDCSLSAGDCRRKGGPAPPVFCDFAGKSWEYKYPELLERYYGAIVAASQGRVWSSPDWGFVDGSGQDGDVAGRKLVSGLVESCAEGVEEDKGVGKEVGCPGKRSLCLEVGRTDGASESFRLGESNGSVGLGERLGPPTTEVEGVDVAVLSPGLGVRPGVGPNGGTSYGRGSNYGKNQAARERRKMQGARFRGGNRLNDWNSEKKRAEEVIRSAVSDGVDSVSLGGVVQTGSVSGEKTDLQKSSELKWRTQNELAALKAEREIAILKATDLEEEKRKRRAQICASTERNLVSIERFHSDLRKSGNTSSDDDTRVNTVLGASAGSISPSSSVSEADVRKAKKDLEDAIAEKNKLAAALTRMGQNPEAIIGYGNAEVGDLDAKTEWTVDSKGRITDDNEAILDVIYPDGYMVIHDDIDVVHPDGKNKVRLVGGPRYSVKESPVEEEDDDDDAKTHWSLDSRNVLPHKDALKLIEKFPDGYDQNYDCYSDAVTGRRRGVIRPTAYVPRVAKKLNGLS